MRLRELQQQFARGVLQSDEAVCARLAANGLPPERRLAIYRNNARANFLDTLAASFPVVEQLGGAAWFRQIGREYMERHPSRAGNLHFIGARFGAFLADRLRGSTFEYFADVAHLEWAYQEVLVAANHPSFDLAALQSATPAEYDALTFVVHPAVRLVASRYPVLAIWRAHQGRREGQCRAEARPTTGPEVELDAVRLDAGPSRVLVLRREDHVELRELSPGEFALIDSFAHDQTFSDAADAALSADASLDLAAALRRSIQLGVFVDFRVASDQSRVTSH